MGVDRYPDSSFKQEEGGTYVEDQNLSLDRYSVFFSRVLAGVQWFYHGLPCGAGSTARSGRHQDYH